MHTTTSLLQPCTGLLEFGILYLLSKGERDTSSLAEELINTQLIEVESPIYPLYKANLLQYRQVAVEDSPPKKYYDLTEEGTQALDLAAKVWKTRSKALQKITAKN